MRISEWSSDVCSSDLLRPRSADRQLWRRYLGRRSDLPVRDRDGGLSPARGRHRRVRLADADRNGRRLCVRRAGRECRGLPQRILIAQEAWSPAPEYLLFAVISDSPDDFIWLEITLALVIAADRGVARRRGGNRKSTRLNSSH